MPKPTFFKLSGDKRARLVQCAIEEFAQSPFHEASLSRIVAHAGIAKGSVYQYFDNKLDLYRWLVMDELPRRKAAVLGPLATSASTSLEALLRALVLSGIRFMLENPELALLGLAASQPSADPELEQIRRALARIGHEGFLDLLRRAPSCAAIRDDVSLELIARILGSVLGHGLRELVLGALDVDLHALLRDPSRAALPRAELERLVDDTVRVLVGGIAQKG